MVDVTFYGFKVSKVIVTLPRKEKDKVEEFPHLYIYSEDNNQITLLFDSYEEIINFAQELLLQAENASRCLRKLKRELKGEKRRDGD